MIELIHLDALWPLAASMAVVLGAQELRAGRRRSALNEALHELRRPLQAIALAASAPAGARRGDIEESLELAAAALERLDREVNGGAAARARDAVRLDLVARASVARWAERAARAGGRLELRWRAGGAVVDGDRAAIAQALDNLIVNAIEHGGPAIVVEGNRRGDRVRLAVADAGRGEAAPRRRRRRGAAFVGLSGRRRHGHGLAVVRRVAAEHDGRFLLRRSPWGSLAVLELPLPAGRRRVAA